MSGPIPSQTAATPKERRASFRDLALLTRGHRGSISFALALSTLGALLSLTQPLLVSRALDQFSGDGDIAFWTMLLACALVADAVASGFGQFVLERSGERIVLGLRRQVVGRLLRWPIKQYDRHRLGDLLTRTTTDTALLRDTLAYDLVELSVGVLLVAGGIGMMAWLDSMLLLIVVAILGTIGALTALALSGIRSSTEDAQEGLGEMNAELERALSAIRTVRVAGSEEREERRITSFALTSYLSSLQTIARNAVIAPTMTLATHAAMIAVLLIGGLRVVDGEAQLGEVIAFLLYLSYVGGPAAGLLSVLATLQRGMAALQRVTEITDIATEQEAMRAHPLPPVARPNRPRLHAHSALAFNDIHFSYDSNRPLFRGLSFEVHAHTITAIIGPSGAGKTTVFALISRFFEPYCGSIYLGGTNAAAMELAESRSLIGLVEQSAPLMHGTLRENILYARPDASRAELDRVVRLASLEPLVARLPNGLDTHVSDHGATLSGGEAQRVAIARALLPRPQLLLLDEPVSHLDAANEMVLQHTFEQIRTESTLLVIAHRGETIAAADYVFAFESGAIRAQGTPEQISSLHGDR